MLWGVFTEHRRGSGRLDRAVAPLHPSRFSRTNQSDWIVIETCQGGSPEIAVQARLIASALLASRGIDIESLPPSDLRTEVSSTGDGVSITRVLVRAGAMHASRRNN